jgi:hypothetical protein
MPVKKGAAVGEPTSDIDALILMLEYVLLSVGTLSPPADEVSAALSEALNEAHAYQADRRRRGTVGERQRRT